MSLIAPRRPLALLAALPLLLVACSSSSSPAGAVDSGIADAQDTGHDAEASTPVTCRKITAKNLIADPDFGKPSDQYSVVLGTPDPALGGATPDEFQIQLYEFDAPQTPGTFDLSAGDEANFATCAHCVVVFEDMDASGNAAKYYFQTAGELTLTDNPTPTTGAVKGSLKSAKLVEVTIDYAGGTYESTPVVGGGCLELDTLDIATTAPVTDAGTDASSDADAVGDAADSTTDAADSTADASDAD